MQQQFHHFQLVIEPGPNASYALTVLQYLFQPKNKPAQPPVNVGALSGLALVSAQDIILDMLRADGYTPKVLRYKTRHVLDMSEESGVRLSLLFKAIAPCSDLDQIRALQQAVWAMSEEETYYWFSKCYGPPGNRGIRALQILFGEVN